MDDGRRIELTLQLWGTGAPDALEEYITRLLALLPRNRGRLERRVAEIDTGPTDPNVLLVLSFPDAVSVDGFMRDPLRTDLEDLAAAAISHSLIIDGHHRDQPDPDYVADVVKFPSDHEHHHET